MEKCGFGLKDDSRQAFFAAGPLKRTTRTNETSGHRHSIYRDTAAQVKRKWRFLTDAEAEVGRTLLEKLRAALERNAGHSDPKTDNNLGPN